MRSLEEEIRKAREACEDVVAYEERKISRDRALLSEVRRVRAFFGLFGAEGEEDAGPAEGEELTGPTERGTRRAREPLEAAKARRVRDFFMLAEVEGDEGAGPAEQGAQQILNRSVVGKRWISDAPFGPGASG